MIRGSLKICCFFFSTRGCLILFDGLKSLKVISTLNASRMRKKIDNNKKEGNNFFFYMKVDGYRKREIIPSINICYEWDRTEAGVYNYEIYFMCVKDEMR